jgi:hypothetical protein
MTRLAGVSSFQWSTSEQVWPFEKSENGATLYCRLFTGQLPNGGNLSIAHGLSGFSPSKVKRLSIGGYAASYTQWSPFPYGCWAASSYDVTIAVDANNIYVTCAYDKSMYAARIEFIYAK